MAAQTTALTEFSTLGNTRTSLLATHVVTKPALVIEKRSNVSQNSRVAEYEFSLVYGADDANGAVLPEKLVHRVTVRVPIYMDDATVKAAALAALKDIVNGDEFASSINTMGWLKP